MQILSCFRRLVTWPKRIKKVKGEGSNMLTELIISLIAVAVYLFILISPIALLIIIIKWAIRKRKEGTSKTYKKYMNQGPYGTGWKWNENSGLWEKDQEIKLHRTEPSYEEWKKAKEQETTQKEEQPSTYSYKGATIPKEHIRIYRPTQENQTQPPKTKPEPMQEPARR